MLRNLSNSHEENDPSGWGRMKSVKGERRKNKKKVKLGEEGEYFLVREGEGEIE